MQCVAAWICSLLVTPRDSLCCCPMFLAHSAFWWIAGDCLGFCRRVAVSLSSNKPYAFASYLRHENVISYPDQLECFTRNGFCLWDIVQSCHRPGSLDQDIVNEVPNDIQSFCREHPSIRRIVLANGASGAKFFGTHFGDWLASGELHPAEHEASQKAFGKVCQKAAGDGGVERKIELVVALAVSPAAARWPYPEKRDFWEQYVYGPGLEDMARSESGMN